jgi:hypothetical protein
MRELSAELLRACSDEGGSQEFSGGNMAINKSQYYLNNTGDKQCVVLYDGPVTEVWDRDSGSLGRENADTFESRKHYLETHGFQKDSNPGWQVPPNP